MQHNLGFPPSMTVSSQMGFPCKVCDAQYVNGADSFLEFQISAALYSASLSVDTTTVL